MKIKTDLILKHNSFFDTFLNNYILYSAMFRHGLIFVKRAKKLLHATKAESRQKITSTPIGIPT